MAAKSDLIVIATAKAQPGKEKALEKALREAARPTRAQQGCVEFALYRSASDPTVIVGYERWASATDHDRHLKGAHVQTLMAAMGGVLAGPPTIVEYNILDEEMKSEARR